VQLLTRTDTHFRMFRPGAIASHEVGQNAYITRYARHIEFATPTIRSNEFGQTNFTACGRVIQKASHPPVGDGQWLAFRGELFLKNGMTDPSAAHDNVPVPNKH